MIHVPATPGAPLPLPVDLRAWRFDVGSDGFAILEWPLPAVGLAECAPAEREVLGLVVQGLSNAEIAAARGRSVRTVANQVASIYRKLGVGSRAELVAALAGRPR